MAPKKGKSAKATPVKLDIASDDEAHSDMEFEGFENGVEIQEKDMDELELEKLVFGDSAGFQENLKAFADLEALPEDVEQGIGEAEPDERGLEALDDADLFFLDSGVTTQQSQALVPLKETESEDDAETGREPAAWEDSDDERLVVSLASVPRLRKLRKTEDEDLITGKEYARRLRAQYERLYQAPDWANPQPSHHKKRPRHADDISSGSEAGDSDIDMDGDSSDLVVQPLAKLLQGGGALTRGRDTGPNKKRKLRPEVLDIQRMKDISGVQPSAITSLTFHPNLPLLLSSGPSSTVYLHHIQPLPPNPNPLLTSLHIKGTPLATTSFHPNPNDSRIFLSARRKYFHIWNLERGIIEKVTRIYGHQHEQRSMEHFTLSPDGRFMALRGSSQKGGGVINFLDATTLQWATQVRIESHGGIADFAWWSDSKGLTIAGKNGEVTEWSLQEQKPVGRWQDEGAVGTTIIALGGKSGRGDWIGGDRWVAVGSSSGIVNIYDRRQWHGSSTDTDENGGLAANPKPTRMLDQLTHPISHLRFSPDGQLLVLASKWKKDALRLVHLPSCTVYRNWPTSSTPLGRITAVTWGKGDGEQAEMILAVANEAGKIRIWEVRD